MAEQLFDTDVFIDHLRGVSCLPFRGEPVAYSVVTRAELFAGQGADKDGLTALLGRFRELEVKRDIAETAGRIRRHTGIAIADALIAATALEHDLPLATRNRGHFERVPGLTITTRDSS